MDAPEVWISQDTWNKTTHGIQIEELYGLECYAGLEILQGLDLHALVLLFPNVREDIHAILPFFWMAEGKVIENRMKMDCSQWVKAGFIKTCPGDVIDNSLVYWSLLAALTGYRLHSLACSPKLETHDILQGLAQNGVEWNPISVGYQGQSTPTSIWEEMFTGKKMEHFGNPVLAWMNQNCQVIRSKDMDMKVQRQSGRSSGIIAGIYALAQWKTVEAQPEESFGVDLINLQ
jgi:phage terminase large subunit-like protein